MFIVDAHLDLSMNAMEWNRDLRLPVQAIRDREAGLSDKPDRAKGTVSLPALREGNIGLVVATQIARFVAIDNPLPGWFSPEQAWAQTQGQLAWFKAMEAAGEMVMIRDVAGLEAHLALWNDGTPNDRKPVGFILSLEGADSLVTIDHLEAAWQYGLRAVGPAHYGPGRYANGTDASGKMNAQGLALLRKMEGLRMILDATHLCDDAFWQAMDHYNGAVWASHNNCRALVDHNRQFSDDMIRVLLEKDAVIGMALDAWMMVPGWQRGVSTPVSMDCSLEKMADHLDHICQLAGNSLHVGMGTDLDGAFGKEQSPYDLETIADLQKVPAILESRGYKADDIKNIMHGNWLRFLRKAWGMLVALVLLVSTSVQAQLSDGEIRDRKMGRYSPDTSFVYALPYKAGSKYLFVQGANSRMSHRSELAFDFKMKPGSVICAARDGVVVAVKEDSDKGGLKDEFLSEGNHIIIEHADKSRSLYWHLDLDGADVNLGDTIIQGQAIGRSGNTGYTAFPHLHFQVMGPQGNEVLPRFRTRKGVKYLRPGRWYK